jgi:energy-coupling factor transporter ATP-binding protein EcfA2
VVEVLRVEELAFAYPQNGFGVKPVSLTLSSGEVAIVSSPSGGGKSTFARCLTGLIPHLYHGKLSGKVWVCNQRTNESPLWQISESAGMVFQNPANQMLASTVEEEIIFGLENLGWAAKEIDQRVEQVLMDFELAQMRTRSPQTLSGGEQQKLALAAVMARQPPLLVLDEPLSMLDTTTAFNLVDHLAELTVQGVTLVICEHRIEYLKPLPWQRTINLECCPPVMSGEKSLAWPCLQTSNFRLEARDLKVTLGGREILDGWNFSLQGGQLTAVVGRNGVGKTTLFRALTGLQPFRGALDVQVDDRAERPQLGMVFQNPDLQLFNASVREEILYGLASPDLVLYAWLLDALDLQRYEANPPLLLSEGEKRRVALATILMRQPHHGVLLDEPALGQDMHHKAMLVRLLRSLVAAGQIVAYSTHDVELALQADRLVLLGSHGIVASGTPVELQKQDNAWKEAGLRLPEWVKTKC